MKARRWLLPALSVLLALAAALFVLPARWLLLAIPANAPVAVVDASGTLWDGQAHLALGPPGMRRTLPQPIAWRWHWVAGIGPSARVEHPWLAAPVEVAPRPGGARLGQGRLTMPADILTAVGAPLNTLEPGGELAVAWPTLDLGGTAPKGPLLQLTWSHASSIRVRVQPLGDYRAALDADGAGGMDLRVQTLQGPLRVEGRGQEHGGRWRFEGQAGPASNTDDATQEALEPLLGLLGSYRDGVSHLRFP